MKIVFPTGEEVNLTEAQVKSIHGIANRFGLSGDVEVIPEFRSTAVLLNAGNMWFGIEEDGYAHT
jgi:hypothetical protein